MNFKPNLWKIIVSICLALIANLFGMVFLGGCVGFINCYLQGLAKVWMVWLIILVMVYIIWSLIEKKK